MAPAAPTRSPAAPRAARPRLARGESLVPGANAQVLVRVDRPRDLLGGAIDRHPDLLGLLMRCVVLLQGRDDALGQGNGARSAHRQLLDATQARDEARGAGRATE